MRGNAFDNGGDEDVEVEDPANSDGFFDLGEMPEEHYGYGASASAMGTFEKADHKFLTYIASSQYLPGVLKRIEMMPVTEEYKKALVDEVSALLSPETAYANSSAINGMFGVKKDQVRVKVIDAKLRLRLTRCAASKSDTRKISCARIEGAILGVFINYLSRSVGKDRERLIQEIASKMTSVSETREAEEREAATPKKRGFWGIGRK